MASSSPPPAGKPFSATVVITNYNYGRFLRGAIDCVLGQTLPGVECVVVDDGSTDGSQEIIASYGDRVKAIHQRNRGQAAALRAGAAIAAGDIVFSLDADDFLYPETCAKVVAAWDAGVSCLNYRLEVYRDEKKTGVVYPSEKFLDSGHLERLRTHGYYPSPPMSGNAFDAGYLRMLLDRAIHMDGDGVDAYLLYSAPVFGRVAHIDEPLGGYRMHGSNISMSSGRKTVKNLGDHIYYQYWAEKNAARFAAEKAIPYVSDPMIKGPYLSLWYLLVMDGQYTRFKLPAQGRLATAWRCALAYATYPNIELFRRFKNIALAAVLGVAPRPLRMLVESRMVDYGRA
jgi:glycosyltransferase involved in cell wall biosynthesis